MVPFTISQVISCCASPKKGTFLNNLYISRSSISVCFWICGVYNSQFWNQYLHFDMNLICNIAQFVIAMLNCFRNHQTDVVKPDTCGSMVPPIPESQSNCQGAKKPCSCKKKLTISSSTGLSGENPLLFVPNLLVQQFPEISRLAPLGSRLSQKIVAVLSGGRRDVLLW